MRERRFSVPSTNADLSFVEMSRGQSKRGMPNCLLLIFFSFAAVGTLHAQIDTDWTEATGRCYSTDVTPEEGWRQAQRDAEANAIRHVLGIRIMDETFGVKAESMDSDDKSNYFSVFSELSRSTTSGHIIAEDVLSKKLETANDYPLYTVKIRAVVARDSGKSDPGFRVDIHLNKDVYYDRGSPDINDAVKFSITASENCYLYLFDIMANDSVLLLIPDPYFSDNYYSAAQGPAGFQKKLAELPIKLRVGLPPGKQTSTEMLYLVALKKKIDFFSPHVTKETLGIIPTYRSALLDLQKWLVRIPRNLRTSASASFTIRRAR